jgi:hypothetical protein
MSDCPAESDIPVHPEPVEACLELVEEGECI